ncbi:MAG: HIT family protein [Betaproteobacteria bacterium]|nr:HIT family protein [Betaproteobacteria bacterium]
MSAGGCVFCESAGGEILWRDELLRIVLAPEPDYPGFLRVVWRAHVREMTDLPPEHRVRLMEAVFAAEQALRTVVSPDKINLASFGNVVPHLHWHVIPRFGDDPHFPSPVWGTRVREQPHALANDAPERLRSHFASALGPGN